MEKENYLEVFDLVVIGIYFVIVISVGLVATFLANRKNAKGFFLAGRSMTFIPIAGSIFASNVGAPMFIGLAGSAADVGFVPTMFEWEATFILIILGWLFVPIYLTSGSYTMPEYLQKRFGGKRLRIYYSMVLLFISIISGISGEIYAGGIFMHELLGWDIYLSTIVILAITAVYTIGGGLAAVIYTDTLQAFVLVIGASIVAALSLVEVGGYDAMVSQFMQAASRDTYVKSYQHGNASCGFPPSDSFHVFRGLDSSYPWPGLVLGLPVIGIFYWCTQQVIVQRNLAAKSLTHSKAACVLASYIKLLPFFIFIIPGMVSRIMYPDKIACSSPEACNEVCSNPAGCTNIAYPLLVLRILPAGLKGLMLAAMLSALMSTLTSHFNSSSSLFTLDIWIHFRKKASQFEVVLVGRLFGLFMIGVSVAWLPILQLVQGGRFWDYIQAISSYITPPWVAAFVLGIFWKRTTEQGVWWGLMVGLVVGAIRMAMEFSYTAPACGSADVDNRPAIFANVHYLTFALILAAISFVVMILVSIVTAPRRAEQIRRVTWWTRKSEMNPELTDDETEDHRASESDLVEEDANCCKKVYNLICSSSAHKKNSPKDEIEELTLILKEDKKWSLICNVNCILLLAFTCFLIGFYA